MHIRAYATELRAMAGEHLAEAVESLVLVAGVAAGREPPTEGNHAVLEASNIHLDIDSTTWRGGTNPFLAPSRLLYPRNQYDSTII